MVFTTVVSHDNRYLWEVECMIENILAQGYSHMIHVLVFYPHGEPLNQNFLKLDDKYTKVPNILFFYYQGTEALNDDILLTNYGALMRPYCLKLHYQKYPALCKSAIWYTDSDIVYTKKINFTKFLSDNINYVSLTGRRVGEETCHNYLNVEYFDKKSRLANIEIDILSRVANLVGIERDTIVENDEGAGGAQYLLKNVTPDFWQEVYDAAKKIRQYLMVVNQLAFDGHTKEEKENNGVQSFCADMWAVLWMLWKRGKKTQCPPELDFSWSTDPISELRRHAILHNAGVTSSEMNLGGNKVVCFHKAAPAFLEGTKAPTEMLDYLIEVDSRYCSYYYVQCLLAVKQPIKFNKENEQQIKMLSKS
jgi:hypothetical protein